MSPTSEELPPGPSSTPEHKERSQVRAVTCPAGLESEHRPLLQPSEQEESRTELQARRAQEAQEAAQKEQPLQRTKSCPDNLPKEEGKDSIPAHQSFLFKLRQQEAAFRRISVTIPAGCEGPRGVRVNVNVDGRAYNIQAPHAVKAGDTMVVHVPKSLPLCNREKDDILQELRRPMKSRNGQRSQKSWQDVGCDGTDQTPNNCDAYSDENIQGRLLQYKALQGRSMEPGVKSIAEEAEPPDPSAASRRPPRRTRSGSRSDSPPGSIGSGFQTSVESSVPGCDAKAAAAARARALNSEFGARGRCCFTMVSVLGRPSADSPRNSREPQPGVSPPSGAASDPSPDAQEPSEDPGEVSPGSGAQEPPATYSSDKG